MALRILDPKRVVRFVSTMDPAYPSEDEATVFVLSPEPSHVTARLRDMAVKTVVNEDGSVQTDMRGNAVAYLRARRAILDVENFRDERGNEIDTSRVSAKLSGVSTELLNEQAMEYLPMEVVHEIAQKVVEISSLSEDDLGNFGEPPTEPSS